MGIDQRRIYDFYGRISCYVDHHLLRTPFQLISSIIMSSDNFRLKGDEAFANRCQNLFSCLDNKEDTSDKKPREFYDASKHRKTSEEDDEGFKKPKVPPPPTKSPKSAFRDTMKNKKFHRFKRDPSKYVKYDLSDVEVTSDKGNSRAAFDFLRKQSSTTSSSSEPKVDLDKARTKFSFRKPVSSKIKSNEVDDKKSPHGLLPETQVGVDMKKQRQQQKHKPCSNLAATSTNPKQPKMTLSHLMAEDEDDDE